ncbi:unnamed protein product [Somion occarium]|uniref:Thioredoxin domain-containing protein n=1 Tax=Somion occarium TaxID=3059160 RepID=A0ABP1D7C4_9APHY
MASYIASIAQAAHHAITSLLNIAEVKPGSTLAIDIPLKENEADKTFTLEGLSGKNIIVGVPGAFTGTCSAQIPGYIKNYEQFKEKGIKDIYVLAVNDVFVLKAWKESLAPNGTPIRFISDDRGAFAGTHGLLFDATHLLGGPRAKRFVLVTEDTKITHVAIEAVPSELTITAAEKILPLL